MKKHSQRFRLLSIGLAISVAIWLGLTVGGVWESTLLESNIYAVTATTALGLLAAWMDALGVERRRRTPGTHAIEDDVE